MSSSYSDEPSDGWNTRIPLSEYEFVDPYTVAMTALNGVWLLALLGVAIWAAVANKSRSGMAVSVFKVHKFWSVILLAIVYYIFNLADLVVRLRYYEVTAAYLLVQIIFGDFRYLAEITLLAVVFGLLFQLLQRPGTDHPRYRGILYLHYAFCCVLLVLYLAIFGTTVRNLYNAVFNETDSITYVNGRPIRYVLDVAYDALYAMASLEVLAISVSIMLKHRNHRTSSSIGVLLIALVALPLFISRFFILGYNVAYEIEYAYDNILEVGIAYIVIAGLAWVLAFAGLVVIGLQSDYTESRIDLEDRAVPEGQSTPSHAPPNAEPSTQSAGNSLGTERPNQTRNRFTEWRPSLPRFNKGINRRLGLGTAF